MITSTVVVVVAGGVVCERLAMQKEKAAFYRNWVCHLNSCRIDFNTARSACL